MSKNGSKELRRSSGKGQKQVSNSLDSEPLEVDRNLGDVIASAIEAFAKNNELQCELWYHNQPVWLLSLNVQGEFFQQVQVAAFHGRKKDELFFIPQAYAFDGEDVRTTCEQVSRKGTETVPLAELLVGSLDDLKKASERISEAISQAWTAASVLTHKDLE